MFRSITIALLTILLSSSSGFSTVSSIPFEISNGLILIKAEVDDIQEGLFIFDTGSSEILINGKMSGKDLEHLESLNGSISTQKIRIKSLQAGSFKKKGISAYVTDLSGIEAFVEKKIFGIIGGAYFSPNEVFIDLTNQRIEISPAFDFKKFSQIQQFKLTEESGISLIELPYNGSQLLLGLDSGASSHILSAATLHQHKIQFKVIETIDLINHEGKVDQANRIQTEPLLSEDLGGNTFLLKNMDAFNQLTGMKLDGFISLTSLKVDFIYMNRNDAYCVLGNY